MNDQIKPIDINTATREELMTVPGIGPALADRIIAARPFQSTADITRVSGISPSKFTEISAYLSGPDGSGDADAIGAYQENQNGAGAERIEPMITEPPASEISTDKPAPIDDVEEGPGDQDFPIVVESEVTDTDALEAAAIEFDDVLEPDEPEMIAVEASALDTGIVEEPAEAEVAPAGVTPTVAPRETREPSATTARPKTAVQPTRTEKLVSRGQAVWMSIGVSLITFVLAVLASLGVLLLTNGDIRYAHPQDVIAVQRRVESLEATSTILQQDLDGLRTRMDNLEGLAGRVSGLENDLGQVRTDVDSAATQVAQLNDDVITLNDEVTTIGGEVDALQESATMLDNFLTGLRGLLEELTLPEGATNE